MELIKHNQNKMQETDSNQWDIFTENEYVYKTETQGSYIRTKTREILTNNYEKPKVENTQKKWHFRFCIIVTVSQEMTFKT